jgi:hypothetical protein
METVPSNCPFQSPLTFLNYTAKSDVVYATDRDHPITQHKRTFKYFANEDVLKARDKAIKRVRKEGKILSELTKDSTNDSPSPYEGLSLYLEYQINSKRKKGKVCWHYLLDGRATINTEILRQMEGECKPPYFSDHSKVEFFSSVNANISIGVLFPKALCGL